MTLEEFKSFDEMEQVSAILEYGVLIAQNLDEDSRMFLYRVNSFYVSASYSSASDQLTDITCFLEVEQAVPHSRKQLIAVNPAEREQYGTTT